MERYHYIDRLKGLAIIFVVFQHIASPVIRVFPGGFNWWTANFFLSFTTSAVPIFLMITGALLLSQKSTLPLFQFFLKGFKKLVIPFIIWVLIYYFFNLHFMHNNFQLNEFMREVIKGFNTKHLPPHLWFMPLIISLYLATPILKRFVENATKDEKAYFLVMSIFFGIMIPVVRRFFDITIPYRPFVFSVLYYFLGYFMISLSDEWVNRKKLFFALLVTGFIFSFIGTYWLSVSSGKYDDFWFNGKSPGVLLISISIFMLFKHFFFQAPKTVFSILFSYLGKMSYGIYLIHQLWLYIIFRIGTFFSSPITAVPTMGLMVILLSVISIYIIRSIPYGKYILPE